MLAAAAAALGQMHQPQQITLGYGKTAKVGDTAVTFARVVSDSRCPVNVNCIWEGNAQIEVAVECAGRTETVELNTTGPKQSAEAEGYSIKLIELKPVPRASEKTKPAEYKATLELKRLER